MNNGVRGLIGLLLVAMAVHTLSPAASAKGCDPACIRLEVVRPASPVRWIVPVCFSGAACWATGGPGPFGISEDLVARVFWTDDRGVRVKPLGGHQEGYSVYFWQATSGERIIRSNGALRAELRHDDGVIWPDVAIAPRRIDVARESGASFSGRVRFSRAGVWLGQVRPRGEWPETSWGSDPVPVEIRGHGSPVRQGWMQ